MSNSTDLMRLYGNMFGGVSRRKTPRANQPESIQVIKIEAATDTNGPKGSTRHYDIITFVNPVTNVEKTTSKFEGKPGYKEWFDCNGAAYSYEGKLIPEINLASNLSVNLYDVLTKLANENK